ncbi:MAG: hypothetical protein KKA16_07080 [Alphaproteobacteria bacterium]|nr:hypothetical protein [Alphaproteobacteria bacterium]MBU2379974.1 hypothetical protein [Alphaproteobacteria bacterium]
MFRRDTFVLLALALFGIVFTIYAVIGSTPFFPKSLQAQLGECPASPHYPAEHRPVMEDYEAEWYSSELLGLQVRPLYPDMDQDHQTVRFSLLRSFHAPVTVTTTQTTDGKIRLSATWASGYDGCDAIRGACSVDRVLTGAEQARLATAQAFLRNPSYGCPTGVDGSMWLLEASGHGEYRFWSEWSPRDGDLRELALVMLDLTGWSLKEIY